MQEGWIVEEHTVHFPVERPAVLGLADDEVIVVNSHTNDMNNSMSNV